MVQATEEMCHYCFDTLLGELISDNSYAASVLDIHPIDPNTQCPLFVTWDKSEYRTGDRNDFGLRGCIGTLSPRPLKCAIRDLSLSAALTDRRFRPINVHEIPYLRVGVSLLVCYEKCSDCFDWEVGVHGIIIEFDGLYNATYLPEVASEQRWNQKQAINSLIRKAGFNGKITDELYKRITCKRYQSSKMKVTYEEYVASKHNGNDPLDSVGPKPSKKFFGMF